MLPRFVGERNLNRFQTFTNKWISVLLVKTFQHTICLALKRVYHAACVTTNAVSSYLTFSPLLDFAPYGASSQRAPEGLPRRSSKNEGGRSVFCGTVRRCCFTHTQRLAVSQSCVQKSSDFPPASQRRASDSSFRVVKELLYRALSSFINSFIRQ